MAFFYYFRSHRAHYLSLILIALGITARLWSEAIGSTWEDLPAVLVFLPLLIGVSAAGSLYEPFGELALTLTATQSVNRGLLVAFALIFGTASIGVGLSGVEPSIMRAVLRNVLGFTGLACWSALLFGARLAWVPPLSLTLVVYVSESARQPERLPNVLWTWPLTRPDIASSWLISSALALGIVIVIWRGPRQSLASTNDA